MNNIHDYGYKKLFSNKTIFRQLLETFVGEEWVKELNFDDCETLDKSFISDHYKETESDIIYRVKIRNQPVFIYVLLEFQSTVDYFMGLRVLNYLTNFYMDYIQTNTSVKKLPGVFPIVLYNGDRSWSAPVNISDLIESIPDLGRFGLNFEYFKIAENEFTVDSLLKIRNIVSTLFLAERNCESELLLQELLSVFDNEDDKIAISLLFNWFQQLWEHGRIDQDKYHSMERVYNTKEEVKNMLITSIQKEKKLFFQQGKHEGKREGKREGILEGKMEIAKEMLSEGFEIEIIARITGISKQEIEKLNN